MADPPRLVATALSATERGLLLVESEALRHDGVVASLDMGDEARFERDAPLASKIGRMTGSPQQDLHLARPIFLIDFDQRLQFSQMMGVAQGMEHALHRVVGLPVIVHRDANDAVPHAAALAANLIGLFVKSCG